MGLTAPSEERKQHFLWSPTLVLMSWLAVSPSFVFLLLWETKARPKPIWGGKDLFYVVVYH